MALHCAAPAAGAILPAQHGRAPVVPCATPLAPANPLRGQLSRSLRRFRVAERRAPLRGQGVVALALPPLLPVVARVVISFALFYTSMQWVAYHGARRDLEKSQKVKEEGSKARKELVNKLTKGEAEEDDQPQAPPAGGEEP